MVKRRSRNWGRIVRMKSDARRRIKCFRRGEWGRLGEGSVTVTIKFKPKASTESCQGSFGRIGFSGLEGNVVDFTRRCAPSFAGAVPFTNDGCTVCMDGDADPSDVDRQKATAVLTRQNAAGL